MRFSLKKNKLLIIIAVFLIIVSLNFYQKEVKSFFYSFSSPIQKFLWQKGQGISGFFKTATKTNSLQKEVENLKFENEKLLSELALLKESKKENETLRKALEIGLKEQFNLVFAEITGKNLNEDYILINKGSTSGIIKGQPVITESKSLLGRIDEVYNDFSMVMLISHTKSSLDAKIQDREVQGIVEGKENYALSFSHIPKDKEILVGDLVITTALGGIFPKDLLVGRIKEVEKSDVKPTQEARVEPLFNLINLESVFVIKDLESK